MDHCHFTANEKPFVMLSAINYHQFTQAFYVRFREMITISFGFVCFMRRRIHWKISKFHSNNIPMVRIEGFVFCLLFQRNLLNMRHGVIVSSVHLSIMFKISMSQLSVIIMSCLFICSSIALINHSRLVKMQQLRYETVKLARSLVHLIEKTE